MFLPHILILACNSSSMTFLLMCSVYKLNKQGDSRHPCLTPFLILNQSLVPYRVPTIAFLFTYGFLRRWVRWFGIHICLSASHSLSWSTQSKVLVVDETEIVVFLHFSCCSYNPAIVGNMISSSSSFSKPSLDKYTGKYTGVFAVPSSSGPHLSELSAMTHPSWVALHGIANNFIELCQPLYHNKAVILEGADSVTDSQISVSCPWISVFPVLDVDLG